MNTLYYGDNLKILREHIATGSVDLIYLDPPFNSNRNYNVLFKNESGIEADSQIKAFDDTWHWNRAAELTYNELINEPDEVGRMIEAFLTLEEPTKPMKAEAVKTGFYHSDGWNKDYPRLQILTVEEILAGKTVDLPPNITTFKRAGKIEAESDDQGQLGFE